MTVAASVICKDSDNGKSKAASARGEEDGYLYELALTEIDRNFRASLQSGIYAAPNSNADGSSHVRKTKGKGEGCERASVKKNDLHRRIESIHAESMRQAERKLDFDTVF